MRKKIVIVKQGIEIEVEVCGRTEGYLVVDGEVNYNIKFVWL